ncbi:BRCT domain protein Brc1 [Pseudohyphozyma bogoriensis]|nr:BRCT domain protein Brc1 [Pseudohyphozyma bogoriensis]
MAGRLPTSSSPHKPADEPSLFSSIVFRIHPSIRLTVRKKLTDLLLQRGASLSDSADDDTNDESDISSLTHYITDTLEFPQCKKFRPTAEDKAKDPKGGWNEQVQLVTPMWVTRSFDLQALQPPQYYSPDRALYFSGFCFCTSELPESDALAIQSGVQALGGQWRKELTREVTHLFALAPHGAKYEAALKYGPTLGMVALLPHWFEESIKLHQPLPIDLYKFPDPQIFQLAKETRPGEKGYLEKIADFYKQRAMNGVLEKANALNESSTWKILGVGEGGNHLFMTSSKIQEVYQKTSVVNLWASDSGSATTNGGSSLVAPSMAPQKSAFPPSVDMAVAQEKIFDGQVVYLASEMGLRGGLEAALRDRIENAGGKVWSWSVDGERMRAKLKQGSREGSGDQWERRREAERQLEKADIVVVKSRMGWEYWKAYELGKTIGNLAWIYHVLSTSTLTSPFDRLVHYPLPQSRVPEFAGKVITISNYSGPARDYVRTLIESLGATFEGAMSKTTDYVVTASEFGAKVKHAKQWKVPLVTHLWLEACILEWSYIDPITSPRYQSSSNEATVNFMTVLGSTAMSPKNVEAWAARDDVKKEREAATLSLEPFEEEVMEEDSRETEPQETSGDGEAMEVEAAVEPEREEEEEEEEEDEEPEPEPTPAKKVRKVKLESASPPKRRQKTVDMEVDEEDVGGANPTSEPEVPEPDTADEDESEAEVSPTAKKGKGKGKEVATPKGASNRVRKSAPQRKISRKSEDVDEDDESSPERDDPPKKQKSKPKPEPEPEEDSELSTAASSSASSSSEEEPPSSKRIDWYNEIPVVGKRGAATAAAAKLKEQMPDANKFAQELARQNSKKRYSHSQSQRTREDTTEEPEPEPLKKKEKKKRKSSSSDEEEEEPKKKVKAVKKPIDKKLQSTMETASGGVSSFDNPPHAAPPRKLSTASKIMIMTTGLGLDSKSPEIKVLTKLGARLTSDPAQVTHLVVAGMSRTEKFLSCLAVAPKILNRAWIDESVKANHILDEQAFLLKDVSKERELGDTLTAILRRAKARKLFEDHTIYVTSSVLPDAATIKRVITCSGGEAKIVHNFDRTMEADIRESDNVYVVSCPKDRPKWEKIAAGKGVGKRLPIYTVEAIFQSCMYQKLKFGDDYRLDQQL